MRTAMGSDTRAYSKRDRNAGTPGRKRPIATPIPMQRMTQTVRYFSKNPIFSGLPSNGTSHRATAAILLCFRQLIDQPVKFADIFSADGVMDPGRVLPGGNQAGIDQHFHMVGKRRLGNGQF